ncbi:MAG: efflux RND transporter permease subunit [Spirochaetia bacterium]|nr:efflux RND transporter permease subunit [Spirochaetia bacterium]
MKSLIKFFMNRSMLVNVILVFIAMLSIKAITSMNRNKFPEVDLAKMIVTTKYPGASPKDVEQNVTRLIEDELKSVTGIDKYTSISSENVSVVTVEIDINYPDTDEVKDNIRRAVDRVASLPTEVTERPNVRDLKSSELPILSIGISGDAEYSEIRRIAKVIEKDLKQISGVSYVDKYSFRDKEFDVNLDPEKLKKYYIALNDVLLALGKRNIRATGGNLESYNTQRNILTLSQFDTIEDVGEVIVRSEFGGGLVKIKDLGIVEEGFKEEKMRTIFNGKRGIMLVIKKSSNADIIRVVSKIKEYLKQKQETIPAEINLIAVNDETRVVANRLDVVVSNAFIGFFLVILILILFLDFKSSFLVALSQGYNKNESILEGTMEVVLPVFASVLTTVLSFAPMFVMTGIMGKFVSVIPTVVIVSLIGSLFNSWFILPNHLRHIMKEKQEITKEKWQDNFFQKISIPYEKSMRKILEYKYITILLTIFLLVFTLYWGKTKILFNIFPPDGADTFFVYVEMKDDVTFDATEEVIKQIEIEVKKLPKEELAFYIAKIGTKTSQELAVPVGGEKHLAYLQVSLVPSSKRKREAGLILEELRGYVLQNVKGAKELTFDLQKPGPPAGKPIELHVHSDNDEARLKFVNNISEDLKNYPGVFDVSSNYKIGREEFKLEIDYKALATTGLTVQDVASTLRIAFDGVRSTSIVRQNEEIEIRVRFPETSRRDIKNVLNLEVRNREGKLVPISSFAKLSTINADSSIFHTNGDVTTTINARTEVTLNPQKVIDELILKYAPLLKTNQDVRLSYGGEAEKSKESVKSLLVAFIGGIVAIFLVIALLFNSLSQPIMVLLAIPFGLIGVIWSFYFHGRPFSFMGLIGVIGLSGIVVNNSIMMVEFINKIVQDNVTDGSFNQKNLIDQIITGASRRLRPIIITTGTTVLGLLPTAYGIGGSDAFIEPMVLALAYGIIASTQITLILIPAFYLANLEGVYFIKKVFKFLLNIPKYLIKSKKSESIING